MHKVLKKILYLSFIFGAINAMGATYLVPQSYDNMQNSIKSIGYGIITESSTVLSLNNYTVMGVSTQYKCIKIQKITCRSSTPVIVPNLSEVVILHPLGGTVPNLGTDLRTEDNGSYWNICLAVVGGYIADTAQMNGNILQFTPNTDSSDIRRYFTSSSAFTASYGAVSYQQICQ